MTQTFNLFRRATLLAAAALLCGGAAQAASPVALSDAQARFRDDMAVCNSGQSNQDATTCRIEARSALAESRRGGLTDTPGSYQQNAMQRCLPLKGDDRADCEARMRGEGTVEGSVAGGGLLRGRTTIVPSASK